MSVSIPVEVKKTCCRMKAEGKSSVEIYNEYFTKAVNSSANKDTFRVLLNRWMKKQWGDEATLASGTYPGFIAHDATVQVSKSGEIIQAWIKQKATEFDKDDFLAALKERVEPFKYEPKQHKNSDRMLEISLFDMHWGIAFLEDYTPLLNELLSLMNSKYWDRIVIPFGQDFFHNDSIINGKTTKGTPIEKVDMQRAVKEGLVFMFSLIDTAIHQANCVDVIYSAGNHDMSTAWMFMQTLLERYGSDVVDDSFAYRKVVTYGTNSIMITHGHAKRATPENLAHAFPIAFPTEFANATVREVHAGHLHHEVDTDVYGIMVRRLSSGGKVDDWSDSEDLIGTHRRFMIFEWDPNSLRSIHYF